MKVMKAMVIQITTGRSSADPVLYMFEFNQNEGMKIDVPADDNLLFFSNSFAIDQPLNGLVTRSNTYAQKVINSSQPLRRKMKLSQKSGTCCHASMQVLLVLGSIV